MACVEVDWLGWMAASAHSSWCNTGVHNSIHSDCTGAASCGDTTQQHKAAAVAVKTVCVRACVLVWDCAVLKAQRDDSCGVQQVHQQQTT